MLTCCWRSARTVSPWIAASAHDLERIGALAADIPALWNTVDTPAANRKEIIRALIQRLIETMPASVPVGRIPATEALPLPLPQEYPRRGRAVLRSANKRHKTRAQFDRGIHQKSDFWGGFERILKSTYSQKQATVMKIETIPPIR
jgi:hypothetical protein